LAAVPQPKVTDDSSEKPMWMARHPCAHCQYVHTVLLEDEPLRADRFVYVCPFTSRETTFAFEEAHAPGWETVPPRIGHVISGSARGRPVRRAERPEGGA